MKRLYTQCRECSGLGGEQSLGHFVGRFVWEQCETCNGSGEIYTGPSGEPEDYVECDHE